LLDAKGVFFMRCFNHVDREAVGSCKACAKGLCSECAVDLGHGLSCRGDHEVTVEAYHAMLERSTKMQNAAKNSAQGLPIFLGAIGFLFAIYGALSRQGVVNFTFILGCAFVVFGVISFVRNRSMYSRK
jgi:hypothetical protein